MEKRARRRQDALRMKARAIFWLRYVLKNDEKWITPQRIGRAATDHCTHQCKMCNSHKHDGTKTRPFSERRKGIADE